MTTYYVLNSVRAGDRIHYPDASTMPHGARTQPIVIIPHTAYGEYSGTAIERSNQRVIRANAGAAKHVVMLHGSWGATGLAYIPLDPARPEAPASVPAPLVEILATLAAFPVVDDVDHLRLECEIAGTAWVATGRHEFRSMLENLLDELDPAFNHDVSGRGAVAATKDDAIDRLWSVGCMAYGLGVGSGFKITTGALVEFAFSAWRQRVLAKPELLGEFSARYCGGRIPALRELAKLTRA